LPDAWFPIEGLPQLLARSDVVVMCAPLTPRTLDDPEPAGVGPSKVTASAATLTAAYNKNYALWWREAPNPRPLTVSVVAGNTPTPTPTCVLEQLCGLGPTPTPTPTPLAPGFVTQFYKASCDLAPHLCSWPPSSAVDHIRIVVYGRYPTASASDAVQQTISVKDPGSSVFEEVMTTAFADPEYHEVSVCVAPTYISTAETVEVKISVDRPTTGVYDFVRVVLDEPSDPATPCP
ncbi:MAG: hypothetical protein ACREA0_09080, partial [bacterium]